MSADYLVIPPRPHTIGDTVNHPSLKDVYGFTTLITTEINTVTIQAGSDDAGKTIVAGIFNNLVLPPNTFVRGNFTSIKLTEGIIQLAKNKKD